jgi:DNA-binding beta-propeller fold protein YncE
VDQAGNVWVADRGNHRIQKFDSQGNFILEFGNKNSHRSNVLGKFDNPRHVEVDKALKYVYVADSKNNRIQQFNINGNFIRVIGEFGKKSGQFDLPTTIEMDSRDNFFVNERGNERVQKFDSNCKTLLLRNRRIFSVFCFFFIRNYSKRIQKFLCESNSIQILVLNMQD